MNTTNTVASQDVSVASIFMRNVYQWMTVGLGITAMVAWTVAGSASAQSLILGNSFVLIALVIAQLGIVVALSAAIHKMSSFMASALFLAYSALTGLTMSSIFIVYPMGAIANAFFVSAGTFLAMSVYGMVTKRDLTSMGSFLTMGLFGILIAMVVNIFLQSAIMDFVISAVGVLVFTGLTAYDTQKIKLFAANAPIGDATAIRRGVILGALTLYLDFINLFLMMLRLFAGNRD